MQEFVGGRMTESKVDAGALTYFRDEDGCQYWCLMPSLNRATIAVKAITEVLALSIHRGDRLRRRQQLESLLPMAKLAVSFAAFGHRKSATVLVGKQPLQVTSEGKKKDSGKLKQRYFRVEAALDEEIVHIQLLISKEELKRGKKRIGRLKEKNEEIAAQVFRGRILRFPLSALSKFRDLRPKKDRLSVEPAASMSS